MKRGKVYGLHTVCFFLITIVVSFGNTRVVDMCPRSLSEWKLKSERSGCGEEYHCMVMQNDSLVEFCMRREKINYGECPETRNGRYISSYFRCPRSDDGCPTSDGGDTAYLSNTLYLYPSCYRLNLREQLSTMYIDSNFDKDTTLLSTRKLFRTTRGGNVTFTSVIKRSEQTNRIVATSKYGTESENNKLYFIALGGGIVIVILLVSTVVLAIQRCVAWHKQTIFKITNGGQSQQEEESCQYDDVNDFTSEVSSPTSVTKTTETKAIEYHYAYDTSSLKSVHSYIEVIDDRTTHDKGDVKQSSWYSKVDTGRDVMLPGEDK